MKLNLKVPSATQRVVVYGPPKCGKTQLVGTLAAHFKLLWFDLENGYVTLMKLPQQYQENVELISIPDSRTFPIAVETMLKVIIGLPVDICEAHGKVGCQLCKKEDKPVVRVELNKLTPDTIVVVDSLTQFSNSCIANITRNQPDDYKMEFDDWGNLKTLVEKFLSQVQAAKYNIVCISHEEEVKLEDGRQKLVPVCGSSKSSRNTAKYFDHVVYCEVKNKKHMASSSTTFSNNILAGSRTDIRMEDSPELTLLSIFKPTATQVSTSLKGNFTELKEDIKELDTLHQSNGEKAVVALTALQKLKLNQSPK